MDAAPLPSELDRAPGARVLVCPRCGGRARPIAVGQRADAPAVSAKRGCSVRVGLCPRGSEYLYSLTAVGIDSAQLDIAYRPNPESPC